MNDTQLQRYARHVLLDAIGIEGQEKIIASRALVIGAGGLGSPAALYLAAAGVGQLTIVDPDTVDLTNLQRQILHTTARVGQNKVDSARTALADINPDVRVIALAQRADAALLDIEVARADVVLDCTDNFATRQAVNRACVAHGVPLVSGAALRFDGQAGVFGGSADAPCYACVFPPESAPAEALCSTMGVFSPLVGIIGSMQAAEALKILAGAGTPLAGQLLMLDGLHMEWTRMNTRKNPACSVCGAGHPPPTTGK